MRRNPLKGVRREVSRLPPGMVAFPVGTTGYCFRWKED